MLQDQKLRGHQQGPHGAAPTGAIHPWLVGYSTSKLFDIRYIKYVVRMIKYVMLDESR